MLTDVLSMLAPQNRRLFKLNLLSHSANDEFLLEHFSGNEALSKLYEFDLALLSHQSDVKLKSLIGAPATVEIELADGSFIAARYFCQAGNMPIRTPPTPARW